MAIAINPDVRELDFSDNVKVSKFMQDFSDFRMKKWITYRPVNAPSESDPFLGGTRQFVINMGTGHILDTRYSGLWYTLYFENGSDVVVWPLQATMPRTSTAWIESVTFAHSNVASHIDERLCDYDSVATAFTPAKDILSMKQTFFTTEGQQFTDGTMFNEITADDPYAKLMPAGSLSTGRVTYMTRSFFIPLYRLSSIFNSGKYFFPSLLRGNGEMTLSIRSVANSLSEVFGGDGSSMAIYGSTHPASRIWSTRDKDLLWQVIMTNMKLVTLNLDNAFLTKEYNAFIASGRKFIRSFKAYNYQFYQVKRGYNRIEIANTHQSISHIVLAFQVDYSIRSDGKPTSALADQKFGIQRTRLGTLKQTTNAITKKQFGFAPAMPPDDGQIKSALAQAPTKQVVSAANSSVVKRIAHGTYNLLSTGIKTVTNTAKNANWSAISNAISSSVIDEAIDTAVSLLPESIQQPAAGTFKIMARAASRASGSRKFTPKPMSQENEQEAELIRARARDVEIASRRFYTTLNVEDVKKELTKFLGPYTIPDTTFNAIANEIYLFLMSTHDEIAPRHAMVYNRFSKLIDMDRITGLQAAIVSYIANPDKKLHNELITDYLKSTELDQLDFMKASKLLLEGPPSIGETGKNDPVIPPTTAGGGSQTARSHGRIKGEDDDGVQMRVSMGGVQLEAGGLQVAAKIVDLVTRRSLSDPNDPTSGAFDEKQKIALIQMIGDVLDDDRVLWHKYYTHMLPAESKQLFDMGMNAIENLQVYRGTGNGETVFSEPVNENMFYHISREAMGDSAENHPYFRYDSFRKDMAVIVISLNTFMRDAHHEFWDGFSTNRVADRLYIEFENIPFSIPQASAILPWYDDIGYDDNNIGFNCKVFTIYDNIYYIDRNNNLNVSDTLLPLQEGRGPSTD